jgi:hypothetical protein
MKDGFKVDMHIALSTPSRPETRKLIFHPFGQHPGVTPNDLSDEIGSFLFSWTRVHQ